MVWGETVARAKTFQLHAGQEDVFRNPARFKAAVAGTGGGKTALGPIWLMQQIKARFDAGQRNLLYFAVAPTYPIMARATAPTLVNAFAGTDLEGRFVPSMSRYYLPDDLGIIWLLSADNPRGLEGGQSDGIWIDEGGQISRDAWIALRGRVGVKQAPILVTTTPYGLNWLYTDFYKPFLDGNPEYYVRQWSSILNPIYPKEEYESAKASMSPQRAAMRYDGEFVRMAGLVYPILESCVLDEHVDPNEYANGAKVGGIDWGWQEPFCALAAVEFINDYGDNILYVWYERYKRQTGLKEHAGALPKGHRWFADPSEPSSINEMRRAGHVVRSANNAIMLGIDAVYARLSQRRLVISPRCKALIEEANRYCYPEKDDEVYGEKPIDANNHALDALRYLVVGVDQRRIAVERHDAVAA